MSAETAHAADAGQAGPPAGISPAKWLALGMALALLIRLIPAGFPSFWYDEYYTLSISRFSPARILHITFYSDVHPPTYYLLIHYLMRIGETLGGVFETQFFLRLASVAFGVATCWLMHRAARARWGEVPANVALLLAAFSPALVNFSIELRDYALVILLILGATLTLLRILERGGWQPRLAAGYVALMTLALYTHSLSFLYLFGHGVLVLAELALRRGCARTLLPQALVAAGAILMLHVTWMASFLQDRKLTFRGFEFIDFAKPTDLLSTYCYYPFFGFNATYFRWGGLPLAGTIMVLIACVVAVVAAGKSMRDNWRSRQEGAVEAPDRLLVTALIMSTSPILLAFALSWAHLAKLFMQNRYNYIALPFMLLAWVGIVRRIRARWLRRWLYLFPLIPALFGLPRNIHDRFESIPEIVCFPQLESGQQLPRKIYFTDAALFPWLDAPSPVAPVAPLLESGEQNEELLLVAQHIVSRFLLPRREEDLIGLSLDRAEGVSVLDLEWDQRFSPCWPYARVWLIPPGGLDRVREAHAMLIRELEARNQPPAGGQRLLPHSEPFYAATGFGVLEIDQNQNSYRWTVNPKQRVSWQGPGVPGDYLLKVHFWRTQPLPEPEIEVFARVTGGAAEGYRIKVGQTGHVALPLPLSVTRPGQRLTLEMEMPMWVLDPSSSDKRLFGMMFLDMELVPATQQ